MGSRGKGQRAIACKARRHRRHSWHSRQCGICNLQNLKDSQESESHSLRQTFCRTQTRAISVTCSSSESNAQKLGHATDLNRIGKFPPVQWVGRKQPVRIPLTCSERSGRRRRKRPASRAPADSESGPVEDDQELQQRWVNLANEPARSSFPCVQAALIGPGQDSAGIICKQRADDPPVVRLQTPHLVIFGNCNAKCLDRFRRSGKIGGTRC